MHRRVVVLVLGCSVMPDGSPSDWLLDRLCATFDLLAAYCANALLDGGSEDKEEVRLVLHVLCSGAAVRGPPVTEASCMRRWLQRRLRDALGFDGADDQASLVAGASKQISLRSSRYPHIQIIVEEEDAARDTEENIAYCVRCLQRRLSARGASNPTHDASSKAMVDADDMEGGAVTGGLWLVTSDFHMCRAATLLHNELIAVRMCAREDVSFAIASIPDDVTPRLPGRAAATSISSTSADTPTHDTSAQIAADVPLPLETFRHCGTTLNNAESETVASAAPATDPASMASSHPHKGGAGSKPVRNPIRCVAAPTPTLSGEPLRARKERELMLTASDTKRQLERLSASDALLQVAMADPNMKERWQTFQGLNQMELFVGPVEWCCP